jgi:hypothetical protein
MSSFFEARSFREYGSDFAFFCEYERELSRITQTLTQDLSQVREEILRLKKDKQGWYIPTLHRLRVRKNSLLDEIERETRKFYAALPEKYVVIYKNFLTADSFSNISALIPQFAGVTQQRLREMPLFTRNVGKLRNVSLGEAGVVGGPCLFGTDEVVAEVTHRDGRKYSFDFNTGRNYENGNGEDMGEHLLYCADDITDVSFVNQKSRITLQEYESLAYPMELASVLGASFIYPIPDMSYRKFLESVAENLNPAVRNKAVEDFTAITEKIADMHIALFYKLLDKYSLRRFILLHERNKKDLDFFYTKREEFFKDSRFARRKAGFSAKTGKNESVYDYISLLASPYYFWGTKHIIQCDVVDETDSMAKCAKIHRNEFVLAGIMYPEILSKNGVDVIFNASKEHKIYYD